MQNDFTMTHCLEEIYFNSIPAQFLAEHKQKVKP